MLDDGVHARSARSATQRTSPKSYASRILRLALLAPDLVEAILAAETDRGMMLERLERPLPASGEEQRGRVLRTFEP